MNSNYLVFPQNLFPIDALVAAQEMESNKGFNIATSRDIFALRNIERMNHSIWKNAIITSTFLFFGKYKNSRFIIVTNNFGPLKNKVIFNRWLDSELELYPSFRTISKQEFYRLVEEYDKKIIINLDSVIKNDYIEIDRLVDSIYGINKQDFNYSSKFLNDSTIWDTISDSFRVWTSIFDKLENDDSLVIPVMFNKNDICLNINGNVECRPIIYK